VSTQVLEKLQRAITNRTTSTLKPPDSPYLLDRNGHLVPRAALRNDTGPEDETCLAAAGRGGNGEAV
jgi:hypothetical protein